jgi:hypothetical protein
MEARSARSSRVPLGTREDRALRLALNHQTAKIAAIAQSIASVQNEAMISATIERGQANLANLERSVMKDNICFQVSGMAGNFTFSRWHDALPRSIWH